MRALLVLLHLGIVASAAGASPGVREVDELLDRHVATVDKCLDSFATKGEMVMDTQWKRVPVAKVKPGRYTLYRETDFRYDGRRMRSINRKWGDVGFRRVPKASPMLNSSVINADFRASYSGQRGKLGLIKYFKGPVEAEIVRQRLGSAWIGASAFGFFASQERIDAILRRCDHATVRSQAERIRGSDCFVIDADTEQGKFTVWIDPRHGYNIVKIHAIQEEGDRLFGRLLPNGHEVVSTLSNVAFKQVDGVWIAVEFFYDASVLHPPNTEMTGRTHGKIHEFLMDPDHAALGSFVVDDFPEGTRVAYTENGRLDPNSYVWKDGRPVPADD